MTTEFDLHAYSVAADADATFNAAVAIAIHNQIVAHATADAAFKDAYNAAAAAHVTARAATDNDDDDDSPDMIRSCDGHESLDGAHMGETVYCDGTCNR